MTRLTKSLRGRLLLSHLGVVLIGVLVVLLAGSRLSVFFLRNHLGSMGEMMGGIGQDNLQLERGITETFNRALLWAVAISIGAALAAASIASRRLLRPLEEVRRVAQRLATGSYTERVPVPEEEELAGLAIDVNALAEALEKTEQRRLQLVAEVAHELRTPIATLTGYLEGLLDGVFEPDPETLAASIREAHRLERLADGLVALSRAEEAQVDLNLELYDLGIISEEVSTRLRPQFGAQGVELHVISTSPSPVLVDHDRVSQVLTNLIGNALSYTDAGGAVKITTSSHQDLTEVTITDSGIGLTEDQASMVFERFYRADRALPGGTGIGLTIARSLARMHGGDITVSSPGINLGSTFILTLPASSSNH